MMWDCPFCETKRDKLFGDLRVNWHPEKHGREHIPFPVLSALRNTLQGHSWKGYCQYDEDEITVLPCCSQHISPKSAVSAVVLHGLWMPTHLPSALSLSAHLQLSNGFWSWGIAWYTSGIPSFSLVIRLTSTVWFQQFLSIWLQIFLIP